MRKVQKGRLAVLLVLSLLGVVGIGFTGAGPAVAAAPTVGLVIDSEIGDDMAAGEQAEYAVADGKLFFGSSTANTFTFKMGPSPACATTDAECDYVVKLGLPTGGEWDPDSDGDAFEDAELVATATAPMVHVQKDGAACTTVAGRFVIDRIDYNGTLDQVTAMVARFEQHCNGDGEDPALFGMLSFNGGSSDPWYSRTVTPASLAFGGVREGTSKTLSFNIKKESGDNLTLSGFTDPDGAAGVWAVDAAECLGTALSANCDVFVTFSPPDDESYSAVLTWLDQLSPTGRDVNLTGSGTSSVLTVINAVAGNFKEVRTGTFSKPANITLANTGTDDVIIGEPEVTGAMASSFAADDGCTNKTLKTGESCVIQVVAYPTAPLLREALLNFNHDATNGVQQIGLRVVGTGGYFISETNGAVNRFGDAVHRGDMKSAQLNAPILGITTSSTGNGYWLVGGDGGIFNFGDAGFHGSTGSLPLNAPILDMEAEVDDSGYWLAASDGGIFAFKAPFHGSMGGQPLNQPVVGIATVPDGSGYWLVATDGGIFAFNVPFRGSMGGQPLNSPIVGMASTADGQGYWMVAADGGVFNFGAPFFGSAGGQALSAPVVGIEPTPTGKGYWLLQADGKVLFFGDASDYGQLFDGKTARSTLGMAGTAPPVNPGGAAGFFTS
jgi:hypothetical protein